MTFTHLGEVSHHEFKMGHHQSSLFANLPLNYYLNQSVNKHFKKYCLFHKLHTSLNILLWSPSEEVSSGSVVFSCYQTHFQISRLPLFPTASNALVMIIYFQEGGMYGKTPETLRLIISGRDIHCSLYLPLQSAQHGWNRIQCDSLPLR